MSQNKKFIEYFPLIDSLRAISVIAVIIYHLDINFLGRQFFSGGYLGVDIFFFISGYLITEIIYTEYIKTGKFNLINFYIRRFKRIVPAILFLSVFLITFSYFVLLPVDLIQFSKINISNIFFLSNFYFHYNHFFYWADAEFNPLLHTWSLAIEVQYYLIFSILIYIIINFFYKNLFFIISSACLISFLLSNYLTLFHSNFSFYMLPSRIFEFLLGTIIFLKKKKIKDFFLNKHLFSQLNGFCIVVLSFIFFNKYSFHPSVMTLIPLIGSMLIIFGKKNFINKFLTSNLILSLGLISYSLYLWHYPIIVFLDYFYIKKNFLYFFYFFSLLTPLVLISYYLIEKTFRNSIKLSNDKILAATIFFYLYILIFSLYFAFSKGLHNNSRFPFFVLNNIENRIYNLNLNNVLCHGRKNDFCYFESNSKNRTVILIGDSIAGRLSENIKNSILKNDLNFMSSTYGGCNFYRKSNLVNNNKIRVCNANFQENRYNAIINKPKSIVVLAGNFQKDFEESNFDNEEGGIVKTPFDLFFQPEDNIIANKKKRIELLEKNFKESIIDLLNKGHYIILVYPIPESGWNTPRKIYQNYLLNNANADILTSHEVFIKRTARTINFFDSIKHPRLFKIQPELLFCNKYVDKKCVVYHNNISYFSDEVHPSSYGTMLINNLIIEKIKYINSTFSN